MITRHKVKLTVLPDLLCILTVFVCTLKLTWKLSNTIDLPENPDELFYFISGINFFTHIPDANWGLLYSLWYNFLSLFSSNNINIIYFNTAFLPVINPCLIYLLLRKFNIRYEFVMVFCFLYLLSPLNLPVQPKVSNFLSLWLIIIYSLISNKKDPFFVILIALIGAFFAVYIRPEFKLSFVLLFILFLLASYRKFKFQSFSKIYLKYSIFVMVLFLTFLLWWGNVFNDNAKRKYVAFGQHFSYNYSLWYKTKNNPFTDWEIVNKKVFNNATTFKQSIQNNPEMFGKHLLFNIKNYFGGISTEYFGLPFPKQYFNLSSFQKILFTGVIIFMFIFLRFKSLGFKFNSKSIYKKSKIKIIFSEITGRNPVQGSLPDRSIQEYGLTLVEIKLLIGLAFFLPTLFAVILMASRMHYFVAQLPSLVFLGGIIFFSGKIESERKAYNFIYLFIICITCFFLTPTPVQNKLLMNDHSLLNITTKLKQLNIHEKIIATGANNLLINLIYPNAVSIPYWDKIEDTYTFIKNKNINLFIVTKGMTDDWRFQDDVQWQDFIRNYDRLNFDRIEIPESQNYILIKHDLLL